MHSQLLKLALGSAIAAALVIMPVATTHAANTSQDVIDARQETQISTTYALSPYLRADEIHVMVHNGKAVLSGRVPEDVNKDLAREIAMGVDGITEVDNQLAVQADYVAPMRANQRMYGEIVDDASISAAIRSKLQWSKNPNGRQTKVETHSGKVTLSGTVESQADKTMVTNLAMNTRGVNAVNNQLTIAKAKPRADATGKPTMEQNFSDSWITTKVKSTYLYSSNVNSSDISVSTSKGVVTLSGRVSDGAERALAIELARNVRGVISVDSRNLTI